MRLGWRLWFLGIVLIISLISILHAESTIKLIVFVLLIGIILCINFLESKTKLFFICLILFGLVIFLIANSIQEGVLVKSVEKDSPAFLEGLRAGIIITEINGEKISKIEDYIDAFDKINFDSEEKRIDIKTLDSGYTIFVNETPKISVEKISKTNIKTGLDLRGGARALVKPEAEISEQQLIDLIQISRNRFNVYGLSDVNIRGVKDLDGNKFMLVEVAGATPTDLEDLIAKQGKFEAKIGNKSVFVGGDEDIKDVCRGDAKCSGIQRCLQVQGGYACEFSFVIYLKEEAAKKHADITKNLTLDSTGRYLSEKLYLYVDDSEVDSLSISVGLKGQVTTEISIQGSGTGENQEQALKNAKSEMNRLQTIMITGSLPYTLKIVKLDTISPALGEQFVYLILLAGAVSLILVSLIILVRYRKIKSSFALLFTSSSELLIILGVASIINWNLDLPSIAGILATIGTGVDQQIIMLDEARENKNLGIKERMKRAMFIILSAYSTALVSLLPLFWAGAGLFKGFALTTLIGISAGVFITRPAFAEIIKRIEEE